MSVILFYTYSSLLKETKVNQLIYYIMFTFNLFILKGKYSSFLFLPWTKAFSSKSGKKGYIL